MTAVVPESSEEHADVLDTLSVVGDNALRLLAGFPSAPSALRIRVGDVTVEAEWPRADATLSPLPTSDPAIFSQAADLEPAPATGPAPRHVVAPMVGVFYHAPEPGARPFVEVGTVVRAGDQVGIVEAMKLMVPVNADADGTVTEILKADGEGVEYGEPIVAYLPI